MVEMDFTAYMDETGHAADESQQFCGMAGFLSTADKWKILEGRWKETLKRFNVDYMHMKEFGPSVGIFKDWRNDESKRRAFLGELMSHLRHIRAIPFGSIYSLEAYRSLSDEDRAVLNEPYLKSLSDCLGIPSFLLQDRPLELKYKVVFSEQSEFKHRAAKIYDLFRAIYRIGDRMTYPEFQDMRDVVALQAADMVAYELNREFARQFYRPTHKPRYGYGQFLKMADRTLPFFPFFFYSERHIRDFISQMKSELSAVGIPITDYADRWRQFYTLRYTPNVKERKRV